MIRPKPALHRLMIFGSQIALLAGLGLSVVGCGVTLEDGYKPRTLGATPDARRAYYASPFSDQAEAGSHESAQPVPRDVGPH